MPGTIAEAARVLRPGGVFFGAAISRWGSALDGLARDLFADPAFAAIVEQDVLNGQHRNATGNPDYFTTAYFHKPSDLREEISAAPFVDVRVYGLEGPSCMLSDFEERWADPRRRADMIRVAEIFEQEEAVIGVSPHMLGIARRATGS
jgi:SAM-dependent methyltransferase